MPVLNLCSGEEHRNLCCVSATAKLTGRKSNHNHAAVPLFNIETATNE